MIRRYIIANVVSTVVLYAAVLALLPEITASAEAAYASLVAQTMESPLIGPLIDRTVMFVGM